MRNATIVVSAIVHVLVFGYALRVSSHAKHRAASVAVIGEKKKKAEEKKPDKPKPAKPKPLVASARPEPKAAPVPQAAPEPKAGPAPVETGLTMDNSDAPGIDIGGKGPAQPKGPAAKGPATAGAPREKLKKEKAAAAGDNPEEDNCTEAPSKPAPMTRPSEIEYTQDARANNVEGRLVLRVTIGADGAVADVVVEKSVEPSLDAAAVAAVKTWTFKPAMRCGKAMAGGVFRLAKTFELGD